jgi:hypothetical protein
VPWPWSDPKNKPLLTHHGLCLQLQQFVIINVIIPTLLLPLLSCGLAGGTGLLLVLLLAVVCVCVTGRLLLLWCPGVHKVWQLGPHVLQLHLQHKQMNRRLSYEYTSEVLHETGQHEPGTETHDTVLHCVPTAGPWHSQSSTLTTRW